MAVTYNVYNTNLLDGIFRYDASGSSFSANLIGESAFDYFDDSCSVGDYIAFVGASSGPKYGNRHVWRGLKLYVGTAFAATSYTIVWEYWKPNAPTGWNAFSGVVDGTNSFATTGENVVMWDPPVNMYSRGKPGSPLSDINTTLIIRARLTAVDTPTEGGAQSTQEVEAGDNVLTLSGYSEETPGTLSDMYDASVAGGWDVVQKTANSYMFLCHVEIEADAWFKSTNEAFYMGDDALDYGGFHINWDGNIQFGEKDDTISRGYNGSTFRIHYGNSNVGGGNSSPQTFKFYASTYDSDQGGNRGHNLSNGDVEVIDSLFNCGLSIRSGVDSFVADRCTFVGGGTDWLSQGVTIYDNLPVGTSITDCHYGAKSGTYILDTKNDVTLDGCKFSGTGLINIGLIGQQGYVTVIDAEGMSVSGVAWNISRGLEQYYTEQYRINLKVLDTSGDAVSGATVSFAGIYDSIDNQTTDENGEIDEQTITYCKAQGIANPTGTFYANPMTVTISKTGYQTQTHKITMDEKKDLVFTLVAGPSTATSMLAIETAPGIYTQIK